LDELQLFAMLRFKPFEIVLNIRAAKVVKKNNLIAIGQQPVGEICPNETDSTRNQSSHASSSLNPKPILISALKTGYDLEHGA
jgi:hypothetical protein